MFFVQSAHHSRSERRRTLAARSRSLIGLAALVVIAAAVCVGAVAAAGAAPAVRAASDAGAKAATAGPAVVAARGAAPLLYVYAAKWGGLGSAAGQFHNPSGAACDAAGNIYVVDSANQRVQKFTATRAFVTMWGSQGSGDGQFEFPTDIACDAAGYVYVVDQGNYRIQKFTADGAFVAKWGTEGGGNGQFGYPTGVACDGSGHVYVVDDPPGIEPTAGYIQQFSSDGTFLTRWGTQGNGNGQFMSPTSVACGPAGDVYVGDTVLSRIQRFTAGGQFVGTWGTYGIYDSNLGWPEGLACDKAGNVFVADQFDYRIKKYNASGELLTVWGSGGTGNGQFDRFGLAALACGPKGQVYAVDHESNRVQLFVPKSAGPQTFALNEITADRGGRAAFVFKVSAATARARVTIKLYRGGDPDLLYKTIKLGYRATGKHVTYVWTRCALPIGGYGWRVYATDTAGRSKSRVGCGSLTVK